MTIKEASERYNIPIELLEEYERLDLCKEECKVKGDWQYDDQDLEHLSMIMTLHDIGFEKEEVEVYMTLLIQGEKTCNDRMCMLNEKRGQLLDEIHFREKQLECMDCLRYKMGKMQK